MTEVDAQVAVEEASLQLDEPRKRPNRSDKRRTLLNEEPLLLGSSWARVWCKSMQTDGRLVVGGWPGTSPVSDLLWRHERRRAANVAL